MPSQVPGPLNSPPEIGSGKSHDPARRVPYTRHRFPLPKITAGGKTFIWPVGTEGFRRSGTATLGIHKYLGRSFVDVHVLHRDEAHIEMTGSFPGLTAAKNMQDLITVLIQPGHKFLYVPGVFSHIQTVYVESYDFPHQADDRTHSIDYTVSFVRTTTGAKIDTKQVVLNSIQEDIPSQDKGANISTNSERVVVVTDTARTFKSIADQVYGDADKWRVIFDLNASEIQNYNNRTVGPQVELMPDYQLAMMRLDVGTRLRY